MKKLFLSLIWFAGVQGSAQMRFSIATDVSLMRNLSPKQKFWAFGQTVQGDFHFRPKEAIYAWITYYTKGKFSNNYQASARSASTSPQLLNYKVTGKWRTNEVSVGWKHYFKGSFNAETGWNLYGTGGFGLMFVKVENIFDPQVDTSLYNIAPMPLPGTNEFKRLTIDVGLGIERQVGGNIFLYGGARTWLRSSNYPSPYLHSNSKIPFCAMINGGVRILFGMDY